MHRHGASGVTRTVEVTVTFLEMPSRDNLSCERSLPPDIALHREDRHGAPGLAAALYRRVGAAWHWVERLSWTPDDWRRAIDSDQVELWTARRGDEVAGYFELRKTGDTVDINYFGLVPAFAGQQLGGPLLAAAVHRAWSTGASRVTVNTCTLDHMAALPNYLARGFTIARTEHQRRAIEA
jgi:GNAT superfamily N-acetyltransferase